ncbi:MAG TPA: CoA-binding protein [Actinomycetota bacterium]
MTFSEPAVAEKILRSYRRFAVVGCSADPRRPSYGVARFLIAQGYDVVCVNPNETMCIEGAPCYPDLGSVPGPIDVVDIFRRADQAGTHVDEAIAIGAKAVWMQLGVIDEAAARRAGDAGLDVVMDRCPAIDHPRLVGASPPTRRRQGG